MLLADVPSAQIDAETLPAVDSMARVLIESLKRELAGKEETIAVLRSQLSDKDDVIATKDKLIDTLQQQIDDLRMQAAIEKGLHTPGRSRSAVAERETAHP
jgi:chromosome segregation ATPase